MKSIFNLSRASLLYVGVFAVAFAAHAQTSAPAVAAPTGAPVGGVQVMPSDTDPGPATSAPQSLGTPLSSAGGAAMVAPAPVATQAAVQSMPPVGLPPLPQLPPLANVSVPHALQDGGLYFSPNQIRTLRRNVEEMNKAASEDPNGRPPRSETSSVLASLQPGSTPPLIRLYMNYPTSLVVVDAAGNPWPIANWAGGSNTIEIKRPIERDGTKGASITMTPRTATGKNTFGGLTLWLQGLEVPVSLTYVGGQPVVDQRVEIRIPTRGPNSAVSTGSSMPAEANPQLLSLLDGVAPAGAKRLKVSQGNAQAWSIAGGRMLVRTPWAIVSPSYRDAMRSADGTNVYDMEQVSELRALSDGSIVSITIDY